MIFPYLTYIRVCPSISYSIFQDHHELPGLPQPPLLHLRVRRPDVLVRVGHPRHLSGGRIDLGTRTQVTFLCRLTSGPGAMWPWWPARTPSTSPWCCRSEEKQLWNDKISPSRLSGLSPLPAAGLSKPLSSIQWALQPPVSPLTRFYFRQLSFHKIIFRFFFLHKYIW